VTKGRVAKGRLYRGKDGVWRTEAEIKAKVRRLVAAVKTVDRRAESTHEDVERAMAELVKMTEEMR
jgi:cytochrome c556